MTLYKNKYRIESARCPKWNYTSNGYYFITICTHNGQHFFGEVINGKMNVSTIGEVVVTQWQKTEKIRPDVQLDAWVIMPNHFHGIVIINKATVEKNQILETNQKPQETNQKPQETTQKPQETTQRVVSTNNNDMSSPRLQSDSLGSIIGQFKSVCTKKIWALGFTEFKWQSRFYDHIIRERESLNRIREYILNNPAQWELDEHNPANFSIKKNKNSS